jgi:Holliday junction resolvase
LANPNGRKGAAFETSVMKWLRGVGVMCERLVRAGSHEEGDLMCVIAGKTYVLELKNRTTLALPEFWREAVVEAENYAKARGLTQVPPAYVIVKRRNAGIEKSWVIQDLEQWVANKQ